MLHYPGLRGSSRRQRLLADAEGHLGSVGYHVVIGLFTIWWTVGLANLAYAVVAHNGADQVMLKLEALEATATPPLDTVTTTQAGLVGA